MPEKLRIEPNAPALTPDAQAAMAGLAGPGVADVSPVTAAAAGPGTAEALPGVVVAGAEIPNPANGADPVLPSNADAIPGSIPAGPEAVPAGAVAGEQPAGAVEQKRSLAGAATAKAGELTVAVAREAGHASDARYAYRALRVGHGVVNLYRGVSAIADGNVAKGAALVAAGTHSTTHHGKKLIKRREKLMADS